MRDQGVEPADTPPSPNSANIARVYDYLLGGKFWYPADRKAGDYILSVVPTARVSADANRSAMHRIARRAAEEFGIRQFLDIGSGIPTPPNLHQVVQAVHPEARVVYADSDPIAVDHGQAHTSGHGNTVYLQADVRWPEHILEKAGEFLDLTQPVALSLLALWPFFPDTAPGSGLPGPHALVRELVAGLPSGSILALTHIGSEFEAARQGIEAFRERGIEMQARSREEIERFFTDSGLQLLDPGVTVAHRLWRQWPVELSLPDPVGPEISDEDIFLWVGVGRMA